MARVSGRWRGFTLVEILIVVVILGVLAAIIVPNVSRATDDARIGAAVSELGKLRRAIEVYQARNDTRLPPLVDGSIPALTLTGEYLRDIPLNTWVGRENAQLVVAGTGPDAAYHTNYGWIYNQETGELWAAAFDAQGVPFPKP